MRAINHALTGAFIGLSVEQPAVAMPAAFLSHFALDAIPHWDPVCDEKKWLKSKSFASLLFVEAGLCLLLVIGLAVTHPRNWLIAAICAFLATSPDLFWIKKYIYVRNHNKLLASKNWFLRFHTKIQWSASPFGGVVELVWLFAMVTTVGMFVY